MVRANRDNQSRSNWLSLLSQADDPNLGAALMRLAAMAATAHAQMSHEDASGSDGPDPRPVAAPEGSAHTEVDR